MRLAATLRCDLRVQWRNGFYYASALIVVGSIALLAWLPQTAVEVLLPVILFENVLTNSFYFVAGLMLLEKSEGTRAAQVVTPLRRGEYVASKVITLGALSLVESLLIAVFAQGAGPGIVPVAVGIALASALMTLVGAALVSRYRSFNEFIMPSVVYTAIVSLPLFGWFGIGAPALYAWHPLQGPLQLMGAQTELPTVGRLVYAVAWPLLWIAPAFLWCRHAVTRSVRA